MIVEAEVFRRKNTVALARWLLGRQLVRRFPDGRIERRTIVETEAYDGERDLACHARAGRTARTDVLYGPGGVWYVYLCYGIHEMLNLVVGPEHWPAAVLIRGVDGAIGPGRVTRALAIDRSLNRMPASSGSGLWIEDEGLRVPAHRVEISPRVGIDYAGPVWSAKPWRFRLLPAAVRPPPALRPPGKNLRTTALPAAPGPEAPAVPKSANPSVRTAEPTARRRPRRDD